MKLRDAKYLSFSSAGTLGNAYFGLVDALQKHMPDYEEWRSELKGVAGCSAGCLCALLVVLGLNKTQRDRLVSIADPRTLVQNLDINLLVNKFAFDDGSTLRGVVQEMLAQGGLASTSTLSDIKRLLRIDLTCACTDLTTSTPVYLNATTAPDVRVCDAVVASCALPLVYRPMEWGDAKLVDGCLTDNLPNVFDETQTAFFYLHPDEGPRRGVETWMAYIGAILRCGCAGRPLPPNAVPIVIHRSVMQKTQIFDLNLRDDVKELIIRAGHHTAVDHVLEGRLSRGVHALLRVYLKKRSHITECDSEETPPDA